MHKIGVIGAGAWGTALAQVMAESGHEVKIWAREEEVAQSINASHENSVFLKGVPLHKGIVASRDIADVAPAPILLLVTPAQFVRPTLKTLKGHLKEDHRIVICSKGIELETGLLMTQVAKQEVPDTPVAVLTGPTFAGEVAQG